MGETFLERAKRHGSAPPATPDSPGCRFNVARLKAGLEWATETWEARGNKNGPWPAELATRWANALDLWMLLEDMTRRIYGWQGCPMEPERCDPAGPFLCLTCSNLAPAPAADGDSEEVSSSQPKLFETPPERR